MYGFGKACGIGAYFLVGRVLCVAVGIAHFGRQHALHLLNVVFCAPETAASHVYFLLSAHQFGILSVAFLFHFGKRNETQRRTVDAVAQSALVGRTVVEHVSEVGIARSALHFGALHTVRIVGFLYHETFVDGLRECRPATARVIFVDRREQRLARGNVYIDAWAKLVVVLVGKRSLRSRLLCNGILFGCELAAQRCVVGSCECSCCHIVFIDDRVATFLGGRLGVIAARCTYGSEEQSQ